jgi:ParB family transcriptional regulator, chromosome partitioning protein
LLFAQIPQCLDATCYHAKLTEHVNRQVAARPELVQIETAHRNPKERRPGTLSRHEYTEIPSPEDENEGAEPVTPCESSKTAIVVYGEGAGSTRTVCTDPGICGTGPQNSSLKASRPAQRAVRAGVSRAARESYSKSFWNGVVATSVQYAVNGIPVGCGYYPWKRSG